MPGASIHAGRVNVMAADQNLAWFTQTIGGKNVTVAYLASSTEDPHHVEPRPSQVAKLSHADLVVRIGMDLDLWLDSLLRAAANGKVSPGGRAPDSDQVYAPLPPDGCRVSENARPTTGCSVPGLARLSGA